MTPSFMNASETSNPRQAPSSSAAGAVRRARGLGAPVLEDARDAAPAALSSMNQAELIQEIIRLRTNVSLERSNRQALENAMNAEWCIEDVLSDIDRIDSIADLFEYTLERLPGKLGQGTRLHFVGMSDYLAVESEAYRRNPQVTDLGEIFRNALSAYLLSRFDKEYVSKTDHYDIHLGNLQGKRKDREYFPITIENSVLGGTKDRTVDVTIGYVELPIPKPGHDRSVDPHEQIRKVMRAFKARLKDVQALLLIEERTRLACEDPLTGVTNRRGFFENVTSLRKKHPSSTYSVITLDLDHFKSVNDKYGHEAGDIALKSVASKLRETLSWRKDLVVSRFGGEEFVIYCQSPGEVETAAIAERLRKIIAEETVKTPKGEINLTVSLGVAECHGPSDHVEDVIARADAVLYRAKSAGRNRVEVSSPDDRLPTPEAKKAVNTAQRGVDANRRSNWVFALRDMFSSTDSK